MRFYKGRGPGVIIKQMKRKAIFRFLENCDLWKRGETVKVRLDLLETRRKENEQLSMDLPSGKRKPM